MSEQIRPSGLILVGQDSSPPAPVLRSEPKVESTHPDSPDEQAIVTLLATIFYANHLSFAGRGVLPGVLPVPTKICHAAHLVCEGKTLQGSNLEQLLEVAGYGGMFLDRDGHEFLFVFDEATGTPVLQTNEGVVTGPPKNPETRLWFQACLEAAATGFLRRRGQVAAPVPSLLSTAEDAVRLHENLTDEQKTNFPLALGQVLDAMRGFLAS